MEVIKNEPFLPMYLGSDGGTKYVPPDTILLQLIQIFVTTNMRDIIMLTVTVNIIMSRMSDKKIW